MKDSFLQVFVDTKKTVLSSKSLFYKTENFIKETKYINNLDFLLSKFGETILLNLDTILKNENEKNDFLDCFFIETNDKKFSFMFKFGYQISTDFNKNDIIFFSLVNIDNNKNNQKIEEYVKTNHKILVNIKKEKKLIRKEDFNKLYLISNISGVNLPKLNQTQKDIVETLDKNILVQGVAGSGKTNICIDKIIFTACKNYSGKVLYTTFSRGLLVDTKLKVELYKKDLEQILEAHNNTNIIFLDKDHKKALENKLGIYFFSDDDDRIFEKIKKILDYLNNKVDYYLIEDIYKNKFGGEPTFVNQHHFINVYCNNFSNHQIEKCFNKLNKYSKEIIYKEIYGMIFGFYSLDANYDIMPLNDYLLARQNSFSKLECETIYQIAKDYKKYCEKNNLLDNNSASKILINSLNNDFEYSLAIIDEVQDYTQANLCLFKKLSLKMFCVGDALQMINPSYFNFGYLKNLLYEKDLTDVKELKYNYRNSAKIEEIVDALAEINKKEFGTHNFVLKGQSIDNGLKTLAVYVKDNDFVKQISSISFDNFTFVVSSDKLKKELQKSLKNQEVLTVSEIKGLERSTIVSYNILSENIDKWKLLALNKINHKIADENSVFRYYYNLFYVGITRAKQNLIVVENENIKQFESFFKENFDCKNTKQAIEVLEEIVNKIEFTEEEMYERIQEFIKLEQFDNARFTANKIKNDSQRIDSLRRIEVFENYISHGKYREAGIKFWEYGLNEDAKKQFILSGDTMLIELLDKCTENNSGDLDINIVDYFEDVKDNKLAQNFIIDTIKKDFAKFKASFKEINENFKRSGK